MIGKVIAIYDDLEDARRARDELVRAGFREADIDLIPGRKESQTCWDNLKDCFRPTEPDIYAEASRRGGAILAVTADESSLEAARAILNRHGPVDMEQRAEEWKKAGWRPQEPPAAESREEQGAPAGGPVRIFTRLTDVPLEEEVRLQVEEVVIQPAVRPAASTLGADLDEEFRRDFAGAHFGEDLSYETCRPGYEFGREMALDEACQDMDWPAIEPLARQRFEQRSPGMWDKLRDSIRRGFEAVRRRLVASRKHE